MIGARMLVGAGLAAAVALVSWRARALSPSGAMAAAVVGALSVGAGWAWGAILVMFFATSIALTHVGRATKARRLGDVVVKGGARDAVQVLANGGIFAIAAVLVQIGGWPGATALGAAAIATATADTWATEIGTLARRPPRSILSGASVPTGTSGAVSLPGVAASVAGALAIALTALAIGWSVAVAAAALIGGSLGSLIDSLLGATVQERRWCDRCQAGTERRVHRCGDATRIVGGLPGLGNDAVNFLSTATGGLLGVMIGA